MAKTSASVGSTIPAVDALLDRLDGVRREGKGWVARCPAHDDRHPSLGIAEGRDGKILLRCRVGCDTAAVLDAAGLTWGDLRGDRDDPPPRPEPARASGEADARRCHQALVGNEAALRRIEELRGWSREVVELLGLGFDGERVTLPVRDATGKLVGLLRYAPNPEHRTGSKLLAPAASRRDLFPAPERVTEEGRLWLVEGEPDALRALSLGLAACGIPGTNGWRSEWADRFRGREVVLCLDCDRAGRDAAGRVARDLATVAEEVRVLDLDPDAEDGFDLTDFTRLATTENERASARRLLLDCAEHASLIQPVDEIPRISAYLSATDPEGPFALDLRQFVETRSAAPATLVGTDEDCILPAGGLALIGGRAYVGKTTLALDFAFHLASGVDWLGLPVPRPLRVLLVENEGPQESFRRKIERRASCWAHAITGAIRVAVFRWGSLTFADPGTLARLRHEIESEGIDIVIADPLGSLGIEGVGSPADTRAFVALLKRAGPVRRGYLRAPAPLSRGADRRRDRSTVRGLGAARGHHPRPESG